MYVDGIFRFRKDFPKNFQELLQKFLVRSAKFLEGFMKVLSTKSGETHVKLHNAQYISKKKYILKNRFKQFLMELWQHFRSYTENVARIS